MLDAAQIIVFLLEKLPLDDRRDVVKRLLENRLVKEALDERDLARMLNEKLAQSGRQDAQKQVSQAGQIRKRLVSDSLGTLSGPIKGRTGNYEISVTQFSGRGFPNGAFINGTQRRRLTMGFVEGGLGLKVPRKSTGGNSETLSHTIYRHFVERYNNGDETVRYEPPS